MCSLDIKVTVWERVEFDSEEEMNDVLDKIKSGELKTGNDVCEYLDKGASYIDDTSEEMNSTDNLGMPTMEILNEDGNTIWNNVEGDLNKYICGCCGSHVSEVKFNEQKDIDECNDCEDK
jgi:hypothetical protein